MFILKLWQIRWKDESFLKSRLSSKPTRMNDVLVWTFKEFWKLPIRLVIILSRNDFIKSLQSFFPMSLQWRALWGWKSVFQLVLGRHIPPTPTHHCKINIVNQLYFKPTHTGKYLYLHTNTSALTCLPKSAPTSQAPWAQALPLEAPGHPGGLQSRSHQNVFEMSWFLRFPSNWLSILK